MPNIPNMTNGAFSPDLYRHLQYGNIVKNALICKCFGCFALVLH